MSKSELFYEEESKTARPHKYSINYKDKNDSVYAIKFYSMQKQIDEKDKEIERLNNIINECSDEILKELQENHHLSYGVALAIRQKLINYRELRESGNNE